MASAKTSFSPTGFSSATGGLADWDTQSGGTDRLVELNNINNTTHFWKSDSVGANGTLTFEPSGFQNDGIDFFFLTLTSGNTAAVGYSIRVNIIEDGSSVDSHSFNLTQSSNLSRLAIRNSDIFTTNNSNVSEITGAALNSDLEFQVQLINPDTSGGSGVVKVFALTLTVQGKTTDSPHVPVVQTYTLGKNMKSIKGKTKINTGKLKVI
jgi:hypothetical protein